MMSLSSLKPGRSANEQRCLQTGGEDGASPKEGDGRGQTQSTSEYSESNRSARLAHSDHRESNRKTSEGFQNISDVWSCPTCLIIQQLPVFGSQMDSEEQTRYSSPDTSI